jgi:hypothetical protein
MDKKKILIEEITKLINANITRHYQYITDHPLIMDPANQKFIPILLKELNKDIICIIENTLKDGKRKKKDKLG